MTVLHNKLDRKGEKENKSKNGCLFPLNLNDTGTFWRQTEAHRPHINALTSACAALMSAFDHIICKRGNFWTVKLNCLQKERAGTLDSRLSAKKTTAGTACLGTEWRTGWACDRVWPCVMEPGGDKLPCCIPNSTWKFSVSTQVCMCDGEISWKIPHVALRQRKL